MWDRQLRCCIPSKLIYQSPAWNLAGRGASPRGLHEPWLPCPNPVPDSPDATGPKHKAGPRCGQEPANTPTPTAGEQQVEKRGFVLRTAPPGKHELAAAARSLGVLARVPARSLRWELAWEHAARETTPKQPISPPAMTYDVFWGQNNPPCLANEQAVMYFFKRLQEGALQKCAGGTLEPAGLRLAPCHLLGTCSGPKSSARGVVVHVGPRGGDQKLPWG